MGSDGINAQIRHHIYVQRLAGGYVRETLPLIRKLAREILQRIKTGDFNNLGNVLADVNATIARAELELADQLTRQVEELNAYEAAFQARLFGGQVPTNLTALVVPMALVSGDKIVNETVTSAISRFSRDKKVQVKRIIEQGITDGVTTAEISRSIRRLVEGRSQIQAEALVRTLTNHAANVGRGDFARENDDLIIGERFLATLDFRTTITCASFDGRLFDVGQGPQPPLHYGCRSLRVMETDSGFNGGRASVQGPVDGQLTYGGWLKRQPREFQDDVLGNERAKLFRSGKLTIDKFTDQQGKVFNLDELRAREGL